MIRVRTDVDDTTTRNSYREKAWPPNAPGAQEAEGDIQQLTPTPENNTQGLGVCKTMERLVKGRLITHLEMKNLISDSQHGFRNKRSCPTSLLDFFSKVIDTYDTVNNKAVDLVCLDFQKAFDKVLYESLMVKVNAHCIQGTG